MLTQHDKLFALYAANIAFGLDRATSLDAAVKDLEYFEGHAIYEETPPAQEETGLWVCKNANSGYIISQSEPIRSNTMNYHNQNIEFWSTVSPNTVIIPEWLAIALVGPMTWEDEPKKVKTT